jgi:hypothetical protein
LIFRSATAHQQRTAISAFRAGWNVHDACAAEIKTGYSGVQGTKSGRAWHRLLNAVKSAFEKMGKDAFASEESS